LMAFENQIIRSFAETICEHGTYRSECKINPPNLL